MTVTQAKLIHALNNQIRLAILENSQAGPKNVTQLVNAVGASQSNVSQHLACLRDCGLIQQTRQGKFYYYKLTNHEIMTLLTQMSRVIDSLNWQEETTQVACPSHMP